MHEWGMDEMERLGGSNVDNRIASAAWSQDGRKSTCREGMCG